MWIILSFICILWLLFDQRCDFYDIGKVRFFLFSSFLFQHLMLVIYKKERHPQY